MNGKHYEALLVLETEIRKKYEQYFIYHLIPQILIK